MTLYKDVDQAIYLLCEECIKGAISLGYFQDGLIGYISQIVSIEDKSVRTRLYDLEACLDGNLALYFGAQEIDHLDEKFLPEDLKLQSLVEPIIRQIQNTLSIIPYRQA